MAVATFDFATESRRVEKVFHAALGDNTTTKTSEGWQGRVHVKVVSPLFDGKSEAEKQELAWEILREGMGSAASVVSLVLAFGMDEL